MAILRKLRRVVAALSALTQRRRERQHRNAGPMRADELPAGPPRPDSPPPRLSEEDAIGLSRHELSAMRGAHAVSPTDEAAGRELIDPGAVELPVGHSADRAYDEQLLHGKFPEPDTTGSTLHDEQGIDYGAGMHEIDDMRLSEESPDDDSDDRITARPTHFADDDDAEQYDSMAPEDRGVEWLTRATAAGAHHEPGTDEIERDVDRAFFDSNTSAPVVGEATRFGAREAEELDRIVGGDAIDDNGDLMESERSEPTPELSTPQRRSAPGRRRRIRRAGSTRRSAR